jgi:hypothetical protein
MIVDLWVNKALQQIAADRLTPAQISSAADALRRMPESERLVLDRLRVVTRSRFTWDAESCEIDLAGPADSP